MSHICRIVQIPETSLRCVYERLRRVGDSVAMIFVAQKNNMFKTLANRSRQVCNACEDFAIPCECFATVRDGLANRFANPSQTCRIPVR